jgi:hypothetical protein
MTAIEKRANKTVDHTKIITAIVLIRVCAACFMSYRETLEKSNSKISSQGPLGIRTGP